MKSRQEMPTVCAAGLGKQDIAHGVRSFWEWARDEKNWPLMSGGPEDEKLKSGIHQHGCVNVQHFRVVGSGRLLAVMITPATPTHLPLIYHRMAWRQLDNGRVEIGLEHELLEAHGPFVQRRLALPPPQ